MLLLLSETKKTALNKKFFLKKMLHISNKFRIVPKRMISEIKRLWVLIQIYKFNRSWI